MKVRDLIRRSLKYLGAVSGADPVPSEDLADALDELNMMVSELATTRGLTLDFVVAELAAADDMIFPAGFHGGLAAMLAERLAPEYGGNIAQKTLEMAASCWGQLAMEYHVIPVSEPNLTISRHTLDGTRGVYNNDA